MPPPPPPRASAIYSSLVHLYRRATLLHGYGALIGKIVLSPPLNRRATMLPIVGVFANSSNVQCYTRPMCRQGWENNDYVAYIPFETGLQQFKTRLKTRNKGTLRRLL